MLLRLRLWAVYYLNELGPDDLGTLTPLNNLASARRAVSGPD